MFAKHTILGEISKCLIDDFQFMEREQPVLLVHMVPYLYKTVSIFFILSIKFYKILTAIIRICYKNSTKINFQCIFFTCQIEFYRNIIT